MPIEPPTTAGSAGQDRITTTAAYALVRVENCCTEFDRVLAVGTQADMEALLSAPPDGYEIEHFDLFVTKVGP